MRVESFVCGWEKFVPALAELLCLGPALQNLATYSVQNPPRQLALTTMHVMSLEGRAFTPTSTNEFAQAASFIGLWVKRAKTSDPAFFASLSCQLNSIWGLGARQGSDR